MISEGMYKDVQAVILENDIIRAAVTPGFGARTASIIYKPLSLELLWQNPGEKHRHPSYGDGYEKGEFAGFDEMFPTISRCFYEDGPWSGIEMPDHGEVWSVPWEYRAEEDCAVFRVSGVRFPYTLEKRVSLYGSVLRGEYTVRNQSPSDIEFIWAAHPLFNTHGGMKFIVPDGMDRIVNAVPGPTLGGYGRELPFPLTTDGKTGEIDLSLVPPRNDRGYQKYYFTQKVSEGWCLLYSGKYRLNIGLSFPAGTVPYLGMWLNEGGYGDQYNIAPEPATGAMDRPDLAKLWGMNSVLPAYSRISWYLNIGIAEGGCGKTVDHEGQIGQ